MTAPEPDGSVDWLDIIVALDEHEVELTHPTPATPEGLRLPWLQMVYELRHPERERVGWQDNADLMRAAADEIERRAGSPA